VDCLAVFLEDVSFKSASCNKVLRALYIDEEAADTCPVGVSVVPLTGRGGGH
jgi:hypothetical protein